MSNEATSLSLCERVTSTQTYETANSIHCIEAAIQSVTSTRVTQVALVTVTLQFMLEGSKTPSSRSSITQSIQYYLDGLRRCVRKTDMVYILDSTFYFILLGSNIEGARIVQNRLWDALLWCVHNTNEYDILRPGEMAVGCAAYCSLHEDVHECIVTASKPCYSFDIHSEKSARKADFHQDREAGQDVSLLNSEMISPKEELTALARKLGIPYLSLLPRKKPEQVQRLVTLKLALELQCYPLGRERGTLTVAFSHPQESSILDRLQHATGLRIFPVLTHPQELQTALSQLV